MSCREVKPLEEEKATLGIWNPITLRYNNPNSPAYKSYLAYPKLNCHVDPKSVSKDFTLDVGRWLNIEREQKSRLVYVPQRDKYTVLLALPEAQIPRKVQIFMVSPTTKFIILYRLVQKKIHSS